MQKPKNTNQYHSPRALVLAFTFCASALGAFLAMQGTPAASAKSLANFNPGNIINDATLANYTTMSVSDIQDFLTRKNPCHNTDYSSYEYYSNKYPNLSWHWTGSTTRGHFVCLSEETFGEGTEIGVEDGETAAEIIYAAAHEYKINPQVLLVLLEKEQSLITDDFPNDRQYRSATGYGCPDTAACDSKYYGFKNQVFQAAELFRYTLDNGSVLFPEQQSGVYVAYHPSASCGSSEVFIENRATAALYRYTPYQPNGSALAAGSGAGDSCSSYGNRNFYIYFTDWFGSTQVTPFSDMTVPRVLGAAVGAHYVKVTSPDQLESVADQYFYFTSRTTVDGELCLADEQMRAKNRCILYDELEENPTVASNSMSSPRLFYVGRDSRYINFADSRIARATEPSFLYFTGRLSLSGDLCLFPEDDSGICFYYDTLEEIKLTSDPSDMAVARVLLSDSGEAIDIKNGRFTSFDTDDLTVFSTKAYVNGELCLGTDDSLSGRNPWCVLYSTLAEIPETKLSDMAVARDFYIPAGTVSRDAFTGVPRTTSEEQVAHFNRRATFLGDLCLQSAADAKDGAAQCYLYDDLREVNTFSPMAVARKLQVKPGAVYTSSNWLHLSSSVASGARYFTQKTYIDGELCLADDDDAAAGKCVLYSSLGEV